MKLTYNDYTYYHTTVNTSPFGGRMEEKTLMKIHKNGLIVNLTGEQWDKEVSEIPNIDYNIEYNMVYENPFIDYR